jgi:hypothetical protein
VSERIAGKKPCQAACSIGTRAQGHGYLVPGMMYGVTLAPFHIPCHPWLGSNLLAVHSQNALFLARRLRAQGHGAQTVYRDRATGAAISAEEYAAMRGKEKRKGRRSPPPEIHVAWKRGLAQQRAQAEEAAAVAREAAKQFGR